MGTEIIQFAVLMGIFLVVGLLWLSIVYIPARTAEKWEGNRPRGDHRLHRNRQ